MARQFLLIDGYNLMHAAGLARRRYGPGDLERCRNRLISFLRANLAEHVLANTELVFDAFETPDQAPGRFEVDGMQIVFAAAGGDADAEIELRIRRHSAPKQLLIVSSDHRLQKAARRRRAGFVDSEVFFDHIEQREPSKGTSRTGSASAKPDRMPSDAETQAWLHEFGEIPEAEQLRPAADDDVYADLNGIEPLD